jgi:hypothetical protein
MIVRPRLLLLLCLLLSVVALPGCGGCRRGGTSASAKSKAKSADEKKKEEDALEELEKRRKKLEKPKDDFEPLAVRMLPSNDPSPSLKAPPVSVKPGHWIAISVMAKTNNFDFPGELTTFTERQATNEPLTMEDTTARLSSWCPAVLAKGQAKRIEGMFYVPRREKQLSGVYSVRSELHGVRSGRTEIFSTTLSPALKDYEHVIVVLASGSATPAAYTHLDKLLSVKMPDVEATEGETLRYYHVFRPTVEKSAPLPSHPLAWTTIAYVIWDDLDPAVLTGQQQQALLDWLHWGGQLIVSGPNSLDKLRSSFLGPYLPGESAQAVKLLQADFVEMNKTYSIKPVRPPDPSKPAKGEALWQITVSDQRPMVGVELSLDPAAQPIDGTGGLVVERRIGGGRVVVTRFPLTDVRIKQWKNFDGFFNSVLLRRPARVFSGDTLNSFAVQWNDPSLKLMRLDARLGSTLRYFTRDIAFEEDSWIRPPTGDSPPVAAESPEATTPAPWPSRRGRLPTGGPPVVTPPGSFRPMPWNYAQSSYVRPDTTKLHPEIDDWHFCGYGSRRETSVITRVNPLSPNEQREPPEPVGVAAWNDQGAASKAAREILTEAAGIEIPTADFVAKVLAVYLLVLVPVNWLLFWLIGKVEWAWVAAPIIALVGAGAVVRLAQLDIGFARSRTEIAVLELQRNYERAHLTRYTALYSSLSSNYALAFDEPTAVAAPFPAKQMDQSLLSLAQETDVAFRRGSETLLSGVRVSSNSTGMVHSEQIVSLGNSAKVAETLQLIGDPVRGFSVRNTTDLTIRDVGVFRRAAIEKANASNTEPQLEVAYVAKLEPASSAPLNFTRLEPRPRNYDKLTLNEPPTVWVDAWEQSPMFAVNRNRIVESAGDESANSRIRLTALARLATDRLRLLPGDVRLVGWTDQRLPGMKIRPEAPQNRTYTLVLAHLAHGPLAAARPDQNLAEDFIDPAIFDDKPEPDGPTDGIDRDTTNDKSPAPTS